ncbi:hypothetical protein IFM89_039306 [Coptis chinensis]|uniref:RNA helicase n=1 Tax=Coptis chinensis TaxID=261450 RepID=A0A835IHQ9_9MAGN|nr:hypothetical protein IFM89_039306 [Coptis chinensis]
MAETKRWGDVVDEPEEESTTNTSTSTPLPELESLKIEEDVKKENDFLEEAEDTNITAVTAEDTLYSTAATFEDLNLSEELLRGLYVEMKFTRPSKIQSVSLPMILSPPYKNLIAQAHNGSGKTTCFVLGMLSRVDPNLKSPQALCVCPTRELVVQNLEVLRKMGKYTGITSIPALPTKDGRRGQVVDQVVIGTPGTIGRWFSYKTLSPRDLKILVFDEADHMLADSGFQEDSLKLMRDIRKANRNIQILLFSATFNETVKSFAAKHVSDPNQMFVKKEELSLDVVKQYKVYCPDEKAKLELIKDRIFELGEKLGQTIIFVNSKNSAKLLHEELGDYGYGCTTLHGNLDKEYRDKVVKEFKDGLTKVLISTDVLARGFDQSQVNLVINYDIPAKHNFRTEPDYEVYLHRCGRAGRFGRKGAVFNFLCTDADFKLMDKIQEYFGSQIVEVPDWRSVEEVEKALKAAGLL